MLGIEQHPWSADVHGADLVAEARASPAVRHFEGTTNKPWLPTPTPSRPRSGSATGR